MAKLRSVNTEFWSDEYIGELSRDEKLLFLYLLTNPLAKISGAYKIARRIIRIDTAFTDAELDVILTRFSDDGKVFYRDGWIVLPNFLKNQSLNDNMRKGAIQEVLDAPTWVQGKIRETIRNSAKLSADFVTLKSLVETLSTNKETLSTESTNRRGIEDEDEKEPKAREVQNGNGRPKQLPNKIESEIGLWLDGVAAIIPGAKDGKDLADYKRWREVVEQCVRSEKLMPAFLQTVRSEFSRTRDAPQFFTPITVLKAFQNQGEQVTVKRKTAAEYEAEVMASMEADRAGS